MYGVIPGIRARGAAAVAAAALVALLAPAFGAATARAEPLSMTFTEARANVGESQLVDAALFEAPDTAQFEAQIDPVSGAITGGHLTVPDFSTHIAQPLNAAVTVQFHIGIITGSFDRTTGVLTGTGFAGGTLTSGARAASCRRPRCH